MRLRVLLDNSPAPGLLSQWGFSLVLEINGKTCLFDAGGSDAFAENAKRLGIPLEKIDYAVLSHAHYDHSDGFPAFFEKNHGAKLYLRKETEENCYSLRGGLHYIGVKPGFLASFQNRFFYPEAPYEIDCGVWLLPHSRYAAEQAKGNGGMQVKAPEGYRPDCFCHEQTMVIKQTQGLVVITGCCHTGPVALLAEIQEAFPNEPIHALIGGLHLFQTPRDEILSIAQKLSAFGLKKLYPGHCTGEEAVALLGSALGDCVEPLYPGKEISL